MSAAVLPFATRSPEPQTEIEAVLLRLLAEARAGKLRYLVTTCCTTDGDVRQEIARAPG